MISPELKCERGGSKASAPLLRGSTALEGGWVVQDGTRSSRLRLVDWPAGSVTSAGLCAAALPGERSSSLCCLGDPGRPWSLTCFCHMVLLNHSNSLVAKLPALMLHFHFCGSALAGNSSVLRPVFAVRFFFFFLNT